MPTTLRDLLGADDLADFAELSTKHGDGWGVARSTRLRRVAVRKRADAARTSPEFAGWARRPPHRLGHRAPALGDDGPRHRPGQHAPLHDGRVAFAHNGSIRPPEALDGLLTRAVAAAARGARPTASATSCSSPSACATAPRRPRPCGRRRTRSPRPRRSPASTACCSPPTSSTPSAGSTPTATSRTRTRSTTTCATASPGTPSSSPPAAGVAAGRSWPTATCSSSAAGPWRRRVRHGRGPRRPLLSPGVARRTCLRERWSRWGSARARSGRHWPSTTGEVGDVHLRDLFAEDPAAARS